MGKPIIIVLKLNGTIEKVQREAADKNTMQNLDSLMKTVEDRVDKDSFIARIPELRTKYGIPPPPGECSKKVKRPPAGGTLFGGWIFKSNISGRGRVRMDFYHHVVEKPSESRMPLVYLIFAEHIYEERGKNKTYDGFKKYGPAVAIQIQNLDRTGWGVDPALTLAVAQHETKRDSFTIPGGAIDSFSHGGVDDLYKDQDLLMKQGFFSSGKKLDDAGQRISLELGRPVTKYPALIPRERVLEVYGAVLNQRRQWFMQYALNIGYCNSYLTEPQFDLNTISIDALRVWTVIFFSGPARGKLWLREFKKRRMSLEKIINNPKHSDSHHYRRGVVNAAEAELLEEKLNLPKATRWKIEYPWSPVNKEGKEAKK